MTTLRYKKRGNKWYVYQLDQYWDKELKKPRQRTQYLGVSESNGGTYSKTGRTIKPKIEKEILDYGNSFAIHAVCQSIGLKQIIQESFNHVDSIMSLMCFQMTEGSAMYHCENWYEGNIAKKLFPMARVASQNVSTLLKHLGRQTQFFKKYIQTFFPAQRGLLIDSCQAPSTVG